MFLGTSYVFAADTPEDDAFDDWFGKGVISYVAEEQGQARIWP